MKTRNLLLSFIGVLLLTSVAQARGTLDFYFIDVEGGAATLIVTPVGESILIDSGFPMDRDANRILQVVRLAGLKRIDHYVTTHWHRDHVGGIAMVASRIPVDKFYDHGLPAVPGPDLNVGYLELYKQLSKNSSITLYAGDEISLRQGKGFPSLKLLTVASNASVIGEERGAPQIKQCGTDFVAQPIDRTDNANSLGFLLTYGDFKYFNGGDMTWNVENKLVCPENLIGRVDLFQVNHHGAGNSNNPTLVRAISPSVAVIDNGPNKGGDATTYITLKSVTTLEGVYQLHRNMKTSNRDNTFSDHIANDDAACQGNYIKASVASNSKKYQVSIPAKKITRSYKVTAK
jgi:competence protein ComEC